MANSIEIAEGSAEAEPDSIDIEALRKERVAQFVADLGVAGPSRYLPVPHALLEYDQEHHEAA